MTSQYPETTGVNHVGESLSEDTPAFPDALRRAKISLLAFTPGQGTVEQKFKPDERIIMSGDLSFTVAVEWLRDQVTGSPEGSPFFLLVHNLIVHDPYDPPEQYRKLFGAPSVYPGPVTEKDLEKSARNYKEITSEKLERFRRQYDQEVRYLDDLVEGFFEQLPEGLLDNTVVIFTSDHGEAFGEHGALRHSNYLYEEFLHIPFLVRAPSIKPRIVTQPISLLDLVPTIHAIFGIPAEDTFLGRPLIPSIQGGSMPEEVLRADSITLAGSRFAVRSLGWKLMQNSFNDTNFFELYNISSDPGEKINVFERWPYFPQREKQEITSLFETLRLSPPQ